MSHTNAALARRPALAAEPRYQTELLHNTNRAHLDRVADLIVQGEIVAFGFNGIFAFVGDADQAIAAQRMADAKGQSYDKPLALVCAPECLDEFVDTAHAAIPSQRFEKILGLQRALHGLGVILPAAGDQLPSHAQQDGTVLNVWFELPPHSPARYLHDRLRATGLRTMIGTSANLHGEPTYCDPHHAMRVFGGRIAAILAHDLHDVPAQHRMSSTMVDFTGERPLLARHGSVPVAQLRTALEQFGLGELMLPAPKLVGA